MRALLVLTLAACSNASDPLVDAKFVPIDAAIDSPPMTNDVLHINEVAASETPDWFEIVNLTTSPVQLDQYVYVDLKDDLAKAKPFPAVTLPAGAYYVQNVDDVTSGFKLASDEELWVYRMTDQMLVDGVDWNNGDSPTGMSFARRPDKTGAFVTTNQSKGLPNP